MDLAPYYTGPNAAARPAAEGAPMTDEELYSLVEIADLMGTPSTTVRYRARLFNEFLNPLKRPKQFRGVRYPASDLPVFELVDRLYKRERSTGDIRRALEEARDGKVIDAEMPESDDVTSRAPLARLSNGPEAVARILRDGIAQAIAPLNDSNHKIAESLQTLHELLGARPAATGDGGAGANDFDRRISEMERNAAETQELVRLRERVRLLEEENHRLREELERVRRPLPLRLIGRARSLF